MPASPDSRLRDLRPVLIASAFVIILALSAVNAISEKHQQHSPPGLSGYYATYPNLLGHRSLIVGRPWGRPCVPEVLALDSDFPSEVTQQVLTVAGEARYSGLAVTVTGPGSAAAPPPTSGSAVVIQVHRRAHEPAQHQEYNTSLLADWTTKPDPDGVHADLASVDGFFSTDVLHDRPVLVRAAVRMLIARSVGLLVGNQPDSGLQWDLSDSADRFSSMDGQALKVFSGC